jgi:geranylgeranylglycerol-phosphate geranylgeranyltransferase
MSQIFFWIVAAFLVRASFVYREKITRALLKNMRPARVVHYSLLVVSGFAFALLSHQGNVAWNWLDVSTFALTLVGFWSAWMFAVCVNDVVDEATDEISNTHRPLVAGTLSVDLMRKAAGGFLATTFFAGLLTGTYTLFFLGTFTAAYWVYSVPPLRLKRVPILSNFLVGIACLSAFLAGFYLVSIDRTLHAVSFSVIAFVLVGFTAAANVKDVKDIAGDRAEGVLTLPVWLGERRARRVIGGMIACVFLAAPLVFGSVLWIPSLAAACLSFAICIQAKMPERGIFALYFLFAAVAFVLL